MVRFGSFWLWVPTQSIGPVRPGSRSGQPAKTGSTIPFLA
jgi:hypothetical protein